MPLQNQMKKPKYRLEPMVILKTRAKRDAESKLAKAIKQVDIEKKKVLHLEERKRAVHEQREKARNDMRARISSGQASVKDSQFHLGFIEKLKGDEEIIEQEIKDQKEIVRQAEDKLKRAKRDYQEAASDLNVIEKHRELWVKAQRLKLNAAENKLMNELGNTVFQINRMQAGGA